MEDVAVGCVVWRTTGTMQDICLAHNKVHEYLGGPLQIVGAIASIDAVAVALQDAQTPHTHIPTTCFEPNTCGDVVIVRTRGESAEPVDLSAREVQNALKQIHL